MPLNINPPLINSANPWATTIDDLRTLYNCPHTGAVTIRTCLLGKADNEGHYSGGFPHNPKVNQYTFFNPSPSTGSKMATVDENGRSEVLPDQECSLNTLGYSPITLQEYIRDLEAAMLESDGLNKDFMPKPQKPFIVSVTGTAEEVALCYEVLVKATHPESGLRYMMEVNLSCPNIPNKEPPAYSSTSLEPYLLALATTKSNHLTPIPIPIGLKTPPYTHTSQFTTLISSLQTSTTYPGNCPISFITSCNTLGSCLVLSPPNFKPALASANNTGIGGLGGVALHPLALGNVATIRRMLDESEELKGIDVIGIGGVSDRGGFDRMRAVGAGVVGVGTALGREGVDVFGKILGGKGDVAMSGIGGKVDEK